MPDKSDQRLCAGPRSTTHGGLPRVWHLFGEEHLPYRLLLLARMIDRETARQLQTGFGLSLAEWRLLAIATVLGPCSASEIGAAGEIDRAEISRALRRLEAEGLMQREADPAHKKRRIITLTEAGKALYRDISEERRAFFRTILSGLEGAERAQVDASLEKIARAMPD